MLKRLPHFRLRRLSRFLRWMIPTVDAAGVLLCFAFFFRFVPPSILNSEPATGGDTGSHFWTLYGLVHYGLPEWHHYFWNPGNQGGEPRLLHYFPLPFLVMALLDIVLPLGTAFNIGTVLATPLLPVAAYLALRALRAPFPVPLLAAVATTAAHYNESYVMWGGNTASTLAGQFAHSYALLAFLLGVAGLAWELRHRALPLFSAPAFAAVIFGHGYPTLSIPLAYVGLVFSMPGGNRLKHLLRAGISAIVAILLSLWFLVPMLEHRAFTTANVITWFSENLFREVFPPLMLALTLAGVAGVILFCNPRKSLSPLLHTTSALTLGCLSFFFLGPQLGAVARIIEQVPEFYLPASLSILALAGIIFRNVSSAVRRSTLVGLAIFIVPAILSHVTLTNQNSLIARSSPFWGGFFGLMVLAFYLIATFRASRRGNKSVNALTTALFPWLLLALFNIGLYYALPKVDLIDARAVPQVHLFGSIAAAVLLGFGLRQSGRLVPLFAALPLTLATLWFVEGQALLFASWMDWNFSGWQAKPRYREVLNLSESIRGNFSDPRIAFELAAVNQEAGTPRVWENLPLFARRATLESVYLEATLLSYEALFLQAEISRNPSCALPGMTCPKYDLRRALKHLPLLGVGGLILATEETKAQAANLPEFEDLGSFGPWTVFQLRQQPSLVSVLPANSVLDSSSNWKEAFLRWFENYDGTQPYRIATSTLSAKAKLTLASAPDAPNSCNEKVVVDFNRLTLQTECPGVPHLLKFNYHPAWAVSSKDEIFAVSPAYIGIVPSAQEVTLTFGGKISWRVAAWASALTFFTLIALALARRVQRPEKTAKS